MLNETAEHPPASANPTVKRVTPIRRPASELRERKYLVKAEVEALIAQARKGKFGQRNALMILLAYRHGLRCSELVNLRWSAVKLDDSRLHLQRVKDGVSGPHFLAGDELRELRKLERAQKPRSEFVFISERGAPLTTEGFARMMQRAGKAAGLEALRVHPHALRHSTGYALINAGRDVRAIQSYLGHKSITSTQIYTALDASQFEDFFPI
ncbi:MAG TPA: tyrosine-type recombinase/integrase [Stellaceae bacterium]|nr:tyrosine-type recombinase/integrase [Stellaceae bacterium]